MAWNTGFTCIFLWVVRETYMLTLLMWPMMSVIQWLLLAALCTLEIFNMPQ